MRPIYWLPLLLINLASAGVGVARHDASMAIMPAMTAAVAFYGFMRARSKR